MLEIILGLLIVVGALGLLAAGSAAAVPAALVGSGTLLTLAAAGMLLVMHGQFRRVRDRATGSRYWLRSQGVHGLTLLATAGLALALPVVTAPLGLFKIGGFPLGYYMAAQGLPIALVVLAFIAARMQDRVDVEETTDDDI